MAHIRSLHAVTLFSRGHYDEAVNLFIDLGINPAKVVALYPESISGRLAKPRVEWIPLFGGPKDDVEEPPHELDERAAGEF